MTLFPTLFVSHGSPMWATEPGQIGLSLHELVQDWPQPRAIAVISAHWLSRAPQISTALHPLTIHDFYGFPKILYELEYPAPGPDSELVQEIKAVLQKTSLLHDISENQERGLDHGAWVPLMHMYPQAHIPVLQIALCSIMSPEKHYAFGQCLEQLRHMGILLIGSGSMTHNLHELQPDKAPVPAYVDEFRQWAYQNLSSGNIDAMLRYKEVSPAGVRAHPTAEHLMPLFVAMGAAGSDIGAVTRLEGQTTNGAINMDAYMFGSAPV